MRTGAAIKAGPDPPRSATVVIPSFNYARFLGEAIESVLAQSRPPDEIIVVDDGSTDSSRDVIARFGRRVRAIFKENGGHASAINAGCRAARADAVFLLDSDDKFEPDAVEAVLNDWPAGFVMTQFRLQIIDGAGRVRRGTVPAPWIRLDSGDVLPSLLATGGFAATLTSGLAFRRDALERVLPIPEAQFRQGADGYLVRAIAFQGPIHALNRTLGLYRRHGDNDSDLGATPQRLGVGLRKQIGFLQQEFETVKRLARQRNLEVAPHLGESRPEYLLVRLGSLVVESARHPIPGDSRRFLLPRLMAAQWHSPLARRMAVLGLILAIGILPRPLAWRVLAWWQTPASRPRLVSRLAGWVAARPFDRESYGP